MTHTFRITLRYRVGDGVVHVELGMDTCFADPYSSRQWGGNENRNGMIRRYPPKRGDIRMDMAGELREIVDEADNEAFADELLELQDQQGCCTSK